MGFTESVKICYWLLQIFYVIIAVLPLMGPIKLFYELDGISLNRCNSLTVDLITSTPQWTTLLLAVNNGLYADSSVSLSLGSPRNW